MMRLTVFTLFVTDQEQALRFYVDRLGFVVSEDNRLGSSFTQKIKPQLSKRPRLLTSC